MFPNSKNVGIYAGLYIIMFDLIGHIIHSYIQIPISSAITVSNQSIRIILNEFIILINYN